MYILVRNKTSLAPVIHLKIVNENKFETTLFKVEDFSSFQVYCRNFADFHLFINHIIF